MAWAFVKSGFIPRDLMITVVGFKIGPSCLALVLDVRTLLFV